LRKATLVEFFADEMFRESAVAAEIAFQAIFCGAAKLPWRQVSYFCWCRSILRRRTK